VLPEQAGGGLLVPRIQRHGLVPVAGRRGALRPAPAIIGDDQLSELAASGDPGERRAGAARSHQEYALGPIPDLS